MQYKIDVLIQGFPGKSVCHGGLGWSTVALVRGGGRTILIDVGAFGVRRELAKQLQKHHVMPEEVTDVVLTHAHYDHSVNFVLFPRAQAWIGDAELTWASAQPPGFNPLPELYVQALVSDPRVQRLAPDQAFLPGIRALASPGHTPGHMIFVLERDDGQTVIFTGDAAKNRTELVSTEADATNNRKQSMDTFDLIWKLWRAKPGTILIPGHDLAMVLDEAGQPSYVGERRAAISAWFSESLMKTTQIDLCEERPAKLFA